MQPLWINGGACISAVYLICIKRIAVNTEILAFALKHFFWLLMPKKIIKVVATWSNVVLAWRVIIVQQTGKILAVVKEWVVAAEEPVAQTGSASDLSAVENPLDDILNLELSSWSRRGHNGVQILTSLQIHFSIWLSLSILQIFQRTLTNFNTSGAL